MKKIFLTTALVSTLTAFSASAQSYQPYYPNAYQAPAQAQANYYNYAQPQAAKKKNPALKHFSIGFDYVIGTASLVDNKFTMDSPLPGGPQYNGNTDMFDDALTSLNVSFGWRPFKYLGFEAYYQKSLSDNKVKHQESYSGDNRFALSEYNLESTSYGLDVIAYLPVMSRLELLATAGVAKYDFTAEVELTGYNETSANPLRKNTTSFDEDKVAFRYGAGAQIWLSQRLAFRAMYRFTSIGGDYLDDISEVALGLRYNF